MSDDGAVVQLPGTRLRRRLTSPEELVDALGIPFSTEQLTAITAPQEPAVIIAGAGSGKTTVMAARVVWLVGTGAVRPEEILGLTFTRKAASELSARVRTALLRAQLIDAEAVDEAGEQVVMTYDAFAARLVAEHGLRIGVDSEQTMVTGATRFRLADRVIAAAAGPFEALSNFQPQTLVDRVLTLDQAMQAHLVDTRAIAEQSREFLLELDRAPTKRNGEEYADITKARAVVAERLELTALADDYAALKRRLGVVEFADQMATAARLVGQVDEVGRLLREQFKVVLLDEFQDTSAAQVQVLRGLLSGPDEETGRGHPVTAVGDPFQAIYGWRGAAASNILEFVEAFPAADGSRAQRYGLTVNRRSGRTILDVANRLAAPLRHDPLLSDGPTPLHDTELRAPEGAGAARVEAASFTGWPEEVSWIAEEILAARERAEIESWSEVAVLVRRNKAISALYGELMARDIPVEIVGLGGLLALPEVRDVVATLRLLDDVTANPELVRLLSGPRWAVGPRDLALLGRRARELARDREQGSEPEAEDLAVALAEAVSDVDPTAVVSLLDAVDDPGAADYSEAALVRFSLFAAELAALRTHADEPVLDLTRRVITTLGLDVELVATRHFVETGRRNQLAAFFDAIADYVDVDQDASLSGLLAYLAAEEDKGVGLEQATPSDSDSVKLMTVHKAKGLEWTRVHLPAMVDGTFPSTTVRDNPVTSAANLPAELRGDRDSVARLSEVSVAGFKEYKAELAAELRRSEDRLAYVAATRARSVLVASTHHWDPELINPRKPSPYLETIWEEAERQDRIRASAPAPEKGDANPLVSAAEPRPWPAPLDPDARERREQAALAVRVARDRYARTGDHEGTDVEPLLLDLAEQVAGWDSDAERLLAEARQVRRARNEVQLAGSLSATGLLSAVADPEAYARALLRQMPRPPMGGARFGSRFHRWVERHWAARGAEVPLIDPDDLDQWVDTDSRDEVRFRELCERFASGEYAERTPHALEAPFTLVLDGLLVRGRIDAVYRSSDPGFSWQVVDWKTGRAEGTDPGQLALYRRAWAEVVGVPESEVDAVFYLVGSDTVVRPELPSVEGLVHRLG